MKNLQLIFALSVFVASGSLRAAGPIPASAAKTAFAADDTAGGSALRVVPAGGRAVVADDILLNRLFQDLYGRAVSASEVEGYLSALNTDKSTRAGVVTELFQAPEFRDNAAYVVKCYLTIMRRDPDFTGWSQILKLMRAGIMEETVLAGFLRTPEYAAAYPQSMSDAVFLETLFHSLLRRGPNAEEVDSLRAKLDRGQARAEVFQQVLTSQEFDMLIDNRVNANLAFLAFLRRSGDAAGMERWTARLQSGTPLSDLVSAFLSSPEYAARF